MEDQELFSACKRGDLQMVQYLVETKDVAVNIRDKWDSTPLYYACLCGHQMVVEYLVGIGARCEANTFDGERCLYGALTEDIKKILTQHNLITPHMIRRDAYDEFLRRIYDTGEGSDVTFIVHGTKFNLHRAILAARSPYFCHMFSSKWRHRGVVNVTNRIVTAAAFRVVLQYIYTGGLECPVDLVQNCIRIAQNCKLHNFKELLEEAIKKALALQVGKHGVLQVTTVVSDPEDASEIGNNLRDLAQSTLPPDFRVWPTEMPFCQEELPILADVCFLVENQKFMCHKMFFIPRSEYFRALLQDHFHEMVWDQDSEWSLPVVTLHHLSAKVFAILIQYLYCNCINMTEELATEVLYAADMYLLPGLKRQCGVHLSQLLTTDNVIGVHRLSRIFNLPRLEDQCVAFMAKHFDGIVQQEELRELIVSDARELQERQETDSVIIVDELRFHLSSNLCSISDIEEAKAKLVALEELLEDLGIEA